MNRLILSDNNIVFQPKQIVKTLHLTNVPLSIQNRRPIMYKIKTNKIDFVDAKPSCGYISGKQGHSQIIISVRALKNQQFTAKLQVLFISHQLITEQVVQKNKTHFDVNQYNEFYETIKKSNQSDAKTLYVSVTKKAEGNSPLNPTINHESTNPLPKVSNVVSSQPISSLNPPSKQNKQIDKPQATIRSTKSSSSIMKFILIFLLGLFTGYLLAKIQDTSGTKQDIKITLSDQEYRDIKAVQKQIKKTQNAQTITQNAVDARQQQQTEQKAPQPIKTVEQIIQTIKENQEGFEQLLPASPKDEDEQKESQQFAQLQDVEQQECDRENKNNNHKVQYDPDTDTFIDKQKEDFQPLKYDEFQI